MGSQAKPLRSKCLAGTIAGKMLQEFFLEVSSPTPRGWLWPEAWSRSHVLPQPPLFPTPSVTLQQNQMAPTSPDVQCASLRRACFRICCFPALKLVVVLQDPDPALPLLWSPGCQLPSPTSFFFLTLFLAGELLKSKKTHWYYLSHIPWPNKSRLVVGTWYVCIFVK